MSRSNAPRISRRRALALAAAAAGSAALRGRDAAAAGFVEVVNDVPFFEQGGTWDESFNCGPATVAAAVNYSQVSFPSVNDVRATLGLEGPTDIDQWAWLLNWYGAPWYSTWSLDEMNTAIRAGHAIVIAAWMSDISFGPDFEQAWSPNWGQSGRYDGFSQGHAMLITGITDRGANYLIHDPNVFPYTATSWYGDGQPKGAYRRYSAAEIWYTISTYAKGQALAVIPPAPSNPRRYDPRQSAGLAGPGGGHQARRDIPGAPSISGDKPQTSGIFHTQSAVSVPVDHAGRNTSPQSSTRTDNH